MKARTFFVSALALVCCIYATSCSDSSEAEPSPTSDDDGADAVSDDDQGEDGEDGAGGAGLGTDAGVGRMDAAVRKPDASLAGGDSRDVSVPTAVGDSSSGRSEDGEVQQQGELEPKGTGPGDWVAGDYPPDIKAQTYLEFANLPGSKGNVRKYKVHVPPSYDPMKPTPVLFCFHGLGQDAVSFCVNATGLPQKSDAEGFVLVMPIGVDNSWDAGTCCSTNGLDEMEFIRAVFDEVSKHVNVDLGRVYATGLSNGGYLSFRVGCELSDIFVAIAPSAGAIGIPSIGGGTGATSTFAKCEPKQRVSVLEMHGTSDPLISYALQKPSLDLMAKSNGCSLTTEAATVPKSGGDTTCVTYTGCPAGVEVTGCSVEDGGHCWFGDATGSCGTGAPGIGNAIVGNDSDFLVNTDVAWDFLKRLSR
jgi:polyhydroxybutyrate depolymerase